MELRSFGTRTISHCLHNNIRILRRKKNSSMWLMINAVTSAIEYASHNLHITRWSRRDSCNVPRIFSNPLKWSRSKKFSKNKTNLKIRNWNVRSWAPNTIHLSSIRIIIRIFIEIYEFTRAQITLALTRYWSNRVSRPLPQLEHGNCILWSEWIADRVKHTEFDTISNGIRLNGWPWFVRVSFSFSVWGFGVL